MRWSMLGVAAAKPGKPRLRLSGNDGRHARAVVAFRAGRFADAYGRFAGPADDGHAPSALMALAMAGPRSRRVSGLYFKRRIRLEVSQRRPPMPWRSA